MGYTATEVRDLIAQGEGPHLEFKARLRDRSILARLISAFGNTGGGVILGGVGDNGQIIGDDVAVASRTFHGALAEIVNAPKVNLEATEIDGKVVVTITVGHSTALTVSAHGAFVREGDRTQPMPAAGIQTALQTSAADPEQPVLLAHAIHELTAQIATLEWRVEYQNTFFAQLPNYLIAGTIGAVLGWLASRLF